MTYLLLTIILLLLLVLITLILLQRKRPETELKEVLDYLLNEQNTKMLQSVREAELRRREDATLDREALDKSLRSSREELALSLKNFNDSIVKTISQLSEQQEQARTNASRQLTTLTESNQNKLDEHRKTLESQLQLLREENTVKLNEMRTTVDEKLQEALEKRLADSFKQVSERLEQVYRGLGEMRTLASGVGDLKRVLTNVKSRGTWGEVQLEALLEQVLTNAQYVKNYSPKSNSEHVEFAIRLPGRNSEDPDEAVWLPIDAKFPLEDYQRLVDAQESGEVKIVEEAGKLLEIRIRACAKDIHTKYLNPPETTDFALLYLPTEGLFAEVIRRPGLTDLLQRQFRVVVAGPTTLWSILNSLQMGFRTLAIEKRSSEVWKLLEAVKTEWLKYNDALEKVQQKLQQAASSIDSTRVRVRAIGRKLKDIDDIGENEAQELLALPPEGGGKDANEEENIFVE